MSNTIESTQNSGLVLRWEWQWAALIVVVATIFASRLTALPVRGEESRWATGASDMIRLGDWVVPRQQGRVFIDRPPMSSWSMAVFGWLRGQVDLVAIRLPSVLSIVLVSLIIYGYARTFLSPTGALAAGITFATAGQVLQLGRLGENESLYTVLLGGGLLGWHYFYAVRQTASAAWITGYTLAALATLLKGIQAPAYFGAAVGTYLLVQRDWRAILRWPHWLGAACFVLVVGLWWGLFYLATDWNTAIAVWSKTVTERFGASGYLKHWATFPAETWGCLLPWSALLLGFLWPGVRRALGKMPDQIVFCLVALPLPYLSLLMATFARGRYFMPLYPLIAIVIGWVVERCVASEPASIARRGWGRFLVGMSLVAIGLSATLLVASVSNIDRLANLQLPVALAMAMVVAALLLSATLLWARRNPRPIAAQVAVLSIAAFLGLAYAGPMINIVKRDANDMTQIVNQIKSQLPPNETLVSLGPVFHRFAWYYGQPIEERKWPVQIEELSPDTEYFCFDWCRGDTPERRVQSRGILYELVPGTLPFQWEKVAFIPCDPSQTDRPKNGVFIGRVIRDPGTTAAKPIQRK